MFDPLTDYTGDVAWEPTVDVETQINLTAEQAEVLRLAADDMGRPSFSSTMKKWHSSKRWKAIRGGTVQALRCAGLVEQINGYLFATERGQGWLAAHPVEVAA